MQIVKRGTKGSVQYNGGFLPEITLLTLYDNISECLSLQPMF